MLEGDGFPVHRAGIYGMSVHSLAYLFLITERSIHSTVTTITSGAQCFYLWLYLYVLFTDQVNREILMEIIIEYWISNKNHK